MSVFLRVFTLIICLGVLVGCSITIGDGEDNTQNEPDNSIEGEAKPENDSDIESDKSNEVNEEAQDSNEAEPTDVAEEEEATQVEVVTENEAFQIFEPAPDTKVTDQIVVRGLARVFEGTVQYTLEDGHFVYDSGFTTASEGGPGWREFEIVIDVDELTEGTYRVVLFEESAEDGSIMHELIIPVQLSK